MVDGTMDSVLQFSEYDAVVQNVGTNESLVEYLREYCDTKKSSTYVVSLSGGVDSMVIATILKFLNKNTVCIHINYNNRTESSLEADFLKSWTYQNNIEFVYHEFTDIIRGTINRNSYEDKTRRIRFDIYRRVLKDYTDSSIILGHHDDDIIENVFNNVCRGRSILDLKVMQKESNVLGVPLSRPLLGMRKQAVYDFAHKYKVPYFKDTTPLWSLRGTYRSVYSPQLEKTYSGFSNNLMAIAEQSDQWNSLIQTHLVEPFVNSIKYTHNSVIIPLAGHMSSPECFWKTVLIKVFHKYGKSTPSNKSIKNLLSFMNTVCTVVLSKDTTAYMDNERLIIIFK